MRAVFIGKGFHGCPGMKDGNNGLYLRCTELYAFMVGEGFVHQFRFVCELI